MFDILLEYKILNVLKVRQRIKVKLTYVALFLESGIKNGHRVHEGPAATLKFNVF